MLPLICSALSFVSSDALLRLPSALLSTWPELELDDVSAPSGGLSLRSSTPIWVHSWPESTSGNRLHRPSGRVPTRRPDFCCVRRIVSPSRSTTQTVASHWAVLVPMSATSSEEGSWPDRYCAKFSAMSRP